MRRVCTPGVDSLLQSRRVREIRGIYDTGPSQKMGHPVIYRGERCFIGSTHNTSPFPLCLQEKDMVSLRIVSANTPLTKGIVVQGPGNRGHCLVTT